MTNRIYFISGHLDITQKEFDDHYVMPILKAMAKDAASFVVGDAKGVDKMAQDFLYKHDYPKEQVTVFHMFEAPRCNPGFPTQGGFMSDEERDLAMSCASTDDIAWVRLGREKSGTAKNLNRRIKGSLNGNL